MNLLKPIPYRTVFWHVIAITAYVLYEVSVIFITGTQAKFSDFLVFYLADISYFYVSTFWVIPFAANAIKKIWLKFILAIFWIAVCTTLLLLLHYLQLGKYDLKPDYDKFWFDFYRSFWRRFFLFFLALGYWYARYSLQKEKLANQKEIQILEAREREARLEIALLRSQVNPHLMYNTLAALYTRMFSKDEGAAKMVLLLSDIMDYALNNGSEDGVSTIAEEVAHIGKLVELQRELYKNTLNLGFRSDISEEAGHMPVPPMLFTNLVDNVFRHGKLNDPEREATIHFAFLDGVLELSISNPIAGNGMGKGRGTGMTNTFARLRKHFPGAHNLAVTPDNNTYKLNLKLYL